MELTDNLYNAFLEDLNALEKFRMAYAGMHASGILERDDPDVRRLIEAMAFFSARTRLSALESINNLRRRLFDQYFSYLLDPLPAMGILKCEVTSRLTEPLLLPKGCEIVVIPDERSQVFFRTLHDLPILPISFTKAELVEVPKGLRILLHFKSAYPRNDPIEVVSLYINYLNNYNASLRFLYTVRQHLKNTSVFFGEPVLEGATGTACAMSIGSPYSPDSVNSGDLAHPLSRIRSLFHFPQQELYLNFKVPPPPRNWTDFAICLELDRHWPKNLNITRDVFQLFTVPIVNLRQSMAEPFLCEGMEERYPIRYPEPKKKFSLHSLLGVYQITQAGLRPLKPGIITSGSGSYEIEHSYGEGPSQLFINLPEAFANPRKIAVEALWMQPWFSEKISQELEAIPYSKTVEGVSWNILGEMRSHQDNPLGLDGEALVQFLSLQKKPTFHLDEIQFLLKALGSLARSPFQNIPQLLQGLKVATVPQSKKSGGIKYIYHFEVKEVDESLRPLLEIFFKQLVLLLQSCSANVSVALRAQIADSKEVLEFE